VLVEWLQRNGQCREVSRQALENGEIETELERLWNTPRPPIPAPSGGDQVAKWLAERL
jgi:hypothetical protein